jgi:hypothetical protein
VITHCVIDAQPASVPVASSDIRHRQWVTVTGTIRDDGDACDPAGLGRDGRSEPKDPYEY